MKKPTKRSKILLSIGSLLVILTVAVFVFVIFMQSPDGGLSGATALAISPASPALLQGSTLDLTVNSLYKCNWFSSSSNVTFVGDYKEVKTVKIQGDVVGTATIEARCGLVNVNKVTTTVTVNPLLAISPASVNMVVANTATLSVPAIYSCNWSSSNPAVPITGATSGSSVTVSGPTADQSTTISGECGAAGAVSASVQVKPLAFLPDFYNMIEDNSYGLSAPAGAIGPCTWTTRNQTAVKFELAEGQYSTDPQTGMEVTLFYNYPGSSFITISCAPGQIATFYATACRAGDMDCLGKRPTGYH